ncbi:hypothetical protein BU16DRAFT_554097 [Lophium mytilinum]|uniref:Uncharacterized protein n=1 Tax=Lophium mytilinum TaxID=390894 RepID=A0A6A6RC46_9PEZI|nr:hypothetical protein BU16DRAFT_554097 [Lophium mytilinum]
MAVNRIYNRLVRFLDPPRPAMFEDLPAEIVLKALELLFLLKMATYVGPGENANDISLDLESPRPLILRQLVKALPYLQIDSTTRSLLLDSVVALTPPKKSLAALQEALDLQPFVIHGTVCADTQDTPTVPITPRSKVLDIFASAQYDKDRWTGEPLLQLQSDAHRCTLRSEAKKRRGNLDDATRRRLRRRAKQVDIDFAGKRRAQIQWRAARLGGFGAVDATVGLPPALRVGTQMPKERGANCISWSAFGGVSPVWADITVNRFRTCELNPFDNELNILIMNEVTTEWCKVYLMKLVKRKCQK